MHNETDKSIETLTTDEKIKLLNDLTDRWKYRHTFTWSTFYKLVIYQFTIISLPFFVYFQLKNLSSHSLGLILFLFSLAILFLVWRSKDIVFDYIEHEDHRQKVVLSKAREIYKKEFNIDIYPSKTYQNDKGVMPKMIDFVKLMILLYAFSVPLIILFMFYGDTLLQMFSGYISSQ